MPALYRGVQTNVDLLKVALFQNTLFVRMVLIGLRIITNGKIKMQNQKPDILSSLIGIMTEPLTTQDWLIDAKTERFILSKATQAINVENELILLEVARFMDTEFLLINTDGCSCE